MKMPECYSHLTEIRLRDVSTTEVIQKHTLVYFHPLQNALFQTCKRKYTEDKGSKTQFPKRAEEGSYIQVVLTLHQSPNKTP